MSPEDLADIRRLAEEALGRPDRGVEPSAVLALLDHLEERQLTERTLRHERNRAVRLATEAEATVTLLREELEEVTAGWFDAAHEVAFPQAQERPLLRAIEGGAGA